MQKTQLIKGCLLSSKYSDFEKLKGTTCMSAGAHARKSTLEANLHTCTTFFHSWR